MDSAEIKQRIYSVDFLRGVVMMIMLLDHTRDFVHAGALQNDPTNPATTTAAVFFTRWITHFCAPIFVFLAGTSIFLQKRNGKSNGDLARFLVTRGLWLIVLEFTVVRLGLVFNFDYSFLGMAQVIWVIGVSMIVMAAVIYLPARVVGIAGLAMILLHNLLDGFGVPPNIAFSGTPPPDFLQTIWMVLHQQTILTIGSSQLLVAYPLIPWVGVMMAGFAFGEIYNWESEKRQSWLLRIGIVATTLFFLLRGINVYGDPAAWQYQETAIGTILSFFNVTKYPPSLIFLLMTIGPGMIILSLTDRIDGKVIWQKIGITFGQVPMFFYILQWFVAHGAGVLLTLAAGKDAAYLFKNLFEMGGTAPPGHGFSLGVTYMVWIGGLVLLYPLCLWWGNLKRRNKHWALSYL